MCRKYKIGSFGRRGEGGSSNQSRLSEPGFFFHLLFWGGGGVFSVCELMAMRFRRHPFHPFHPSVPLSMETQRPLDATRHAKVVVEHTGTGGGGVDKEQGGYNGSLNQQPL